MNERKVRLDERNNYAENYLTLIKAIIKETTSIISEIKKSMSEV